MRSVRELMRTMLLLVALLLPGSLLPATELDTRALLEAINSRRAAQGLHPLQANIALTQAAEDRMSEMLDLQYWAHVSPDGRQPFGWLRARGYAYNRAGENLARGFDTAEVLVDAWMESPGHRATMLSPWYRDIGLAVIEGATTGRAEGHSVVALFGSAPTP